MKETKCSSMSNLYYDEVRNYFYIKMDNDGDWHGRLFYSSQYICSSNTHINTVTCIYSCAYVNQNWKGV